MDSLKHFLRDERGLETVEYAIILGMIVAGTIGLIAGIGGWVYDRFARVSGELADSGAP
jgi:pilus assembly protein Flp/PilA